MLLGTAQLLIHVNHIQFWTLIKVQLSIAVISNVPWFSVWCSHLSEYTPLLAFSQHEEWQYFYQSTFSLFFDLVEQSSSWLLLFLLFVCVWLLKQQDVFYLFLFTPQEFFAYGVMNLGGSFFGCFPMATPRWSYSSPQVLSSSSSCFSAFSSLLF